jgi:hypothetical protein
VATCFGYCTIVVTCTYKAEMFFPRGSLQLIASRRGYFRGGKRLPSRRQIWFGLKLSFGQRAVHRSEMYDICAGEPVIQVLFCNH